MQRKMDKEELKEYIFMAVQATKQENSGLIEHINKKIETVSDQLNVKMDTLNGEIKQMKDDIAELKEDVKPLENTQAWFKITKDWAVYWSGLLTPLIVIGGVILWVYNKIK